MQPLHEVNSDGETHMVEYSAIFGKIQLHVILIMSDLDDINTIRYKSVIIKYMMSQSVIG